MVRALNKREKVIFMLCVLTLGIYVCYQVVFVAIQSQIASLDKKIEIERHSLSRNLRKINKAKELNPQYQSFIDQFQQRENNEQMLSSMLNEIEEEAKNYNLQISNLNPKKVKEEEFFKRFSVSLTINSEFDDILQFIYNLQSQPYFFEIEEVRFDKGTRRKVTTIKTQLVLSKVTIP